jgi:pyruvyltransferase
LSVFIINNLINKNKYQLVYNSNKNIQKTKYINLLCIGSYIHKVEDNCYVFGTGIRTEKNFLDKLEYINQIKNLNILSVRGPLTKNILNNNKIKCPEIYGDPALLIKLFYNPFFIENLKNKICIIPHMTNYYKYTKYNNDIYEVVSPFENFYTILNYIYSCKYIISSSLHGLICSDAYNKPNVWLYEYELDEGTLKFHDYFLSQNREIISIKSIDEFNEEKLYKDGNKINLEKLMNLFPFV